MSHNLHATADEDGVPFAMTHVYNGTNRKYRIVVSQLTDATSAKSMLLLADPEGKLYTVTSAKFRSRFTYIPGGK